MLPNPNPNPFKKSWFSTEFIGALVLITVAAYFKNIYAITILTCVYSMARGIQKKGRAMFLHGGQKTTEFYVALTSIGLVFWLNHENLGFVCMSLIFGAYALSRGYTKSFSQPPVKVNHF